MRTLLTTFLFLFCAGATLLAQESKAPTALQALKLLPKGESKYLARIEAREGKPNPERWHIIVHDPKESSGLHEYVIAGDELVASRAVSQFVESITSEDVIGPDPVKLDSDKVGALVQQYVLANNASVAAMNYQLLREGEGAAPIWKVTCVDDTGHTVGSIVLTASKGTVVSHDGFPIDPAKEKEKLAVHASDEIANPNTTDTEDPKPAAKATPAKKSASNTRTRTTRDDGSDDDAPRRGEKGFFHRAGGKLQKFFTGRDTLSR